MTSILLGVRMTGVIVPAVPILVVAAVLDADDDAALEVLGNDVDPVGDEVKELSTVDESFVNQSNFIEIRLQNVAYIFMLGFFTEYVSKFEICDVIFKDGQQLRFNNI
jgi:hypothetical protein